MGSPRTRSVTPRRIHPRASSCETSRAIVHRALDATRGRRDRYFDALATAAKHYTAETALHVGVLLEQRECPPADRLGQGLRPQVRRPDGVGLADEAGHQAGTCACKHAAARDGVIGHGVPPDLPE